MKGHLPNVVCVVACLVAATVLTFQILRDKSLPDARLGVFAFLLFAAGINIVVILT